MGKRDSWEGSQGVTAILVAGGEDDGKSSLAVRIAGPVVFEDIAVDEHAAGVLEFENVLDNPVDARVGGVADFPRQRLEEVVAADLDIGGPVGLAAGIGASEDHVLAGALQVVIDDLEGTWSGPAPDGHGVELSMVHLGDPRIDDRKARAVKDEADPEVLARPAVHVAAVEDDVGTAQVGEV